MSCIDCEDRPECLHRLRKRLQAVEAERDRALEAAGTWGADRMLRRCEKAEAERDELAKRTELAETEWAYTLDQRDEAEAKLEAVREASFDDEARMPNTVKALLRANLRVRKMIDTDPAAILTERDERVRREAVAYAVLVMRETVWRSGVTEVGMVDAIMIGLAGPSDPKGGE